MVMAGTVLVVTAKIWIEKSFGLKAAALGIARWGLWVVEVVFGHWSFGFKHLLKLALSRLTRGK